MQYEGGHKGSCGDCLLVLCWGNERASFDIKSDAIYTEPHHFSIKAHMKLLFPTYIPLPGCKCSGIDSGSGRTMLLLRVLITWQEETVRFEMPHAGTGDRDLLLLLDTHLHIH